MIQDSIDHDAVAIGLQALTASPVGWWRVLDPQTTWWSPSMFDLFELDPAGGVPTPEEIFRLYHPDDTNIVARGWVQMFTTDEQVELRYRIMLPGGRTRHVANWSQRQPPDAEGRRWVVGIMLDVTNQVGDHALFESERAFRFVAENTQDMVVRCDIDGGITFVSPASKTVLGYRPAEMLGRHPAEFVASDDLERVREILRDRIARQELISAVGHEYRAIHKDGSEVWLEANPRLVLNGAGQLTEMVDVVRNITARKEAEATLEVARATAEAAALAKSEFLANMSHELRTPLTSIIGFSRVIGVGGGLSETDRRHLGLVQQAGETLLSVVNDILDFSKLEAGAVALDPVAFSSRDLVSGVADLLKAQADAKGLSLTCRIEDDARLFGDAARLRQVVMNLVGNAVKFTEAGSVDISARTQPDAHGRMFLSVDVADSGVGIDPEQIERLFDRFSQADNSVSRRFGGTGLGLAISRRLIGLMGGEIGARSDGPLGSTFWFRVPLDIAPAEQEAVSEAAPSVPERALNVLLAEDNPANRTLVAALLAPFDIVLTMVEDGRAAVETAASAPFDLILMDMQMPRMDGASASRAIRASAGPERDVPIIALTANVLPEQIAQCRAAGMQAHLAKPIDPRALLDAITEHARPSLATRAA